MSYSPWFAVRQADQDRRQQRLRMEYAVSRVTEGVLAEPWVQPVIARVGAAIDPDYPARMDLVQQIVLDVISARTRPRHPVHPKFTSAPARSTFPKAAKRTGAEGATA